MRRICRRGFQNSVCGLKQQQSQSCCGKFSKQNQHIYSLIILRRRRESFLGFSGAMAATSVQRNVLLWSPAVDSEVSSFTHTDFIHKKCMCCFLLTPPGLSDKGCIANTTYLIGWVEYETIGSTLLRLSRTHQTQVRDLGHFGPSARRLKCRAEASDCSIKQVI